MSWFPVDDAFHSHPKARKAGFEAIGLWTVSGSYCMAYLTDGFVPEWFVKEKPKGVALAKRLVTAGLWRPGEKDDDLGWWFHDWRSENTKEQVLAAREKARLRKAKSRESQGESHRDIPRDEQRESPVLSGPTHANPTQPKEKNSGSEPDKPPVSSPTNSARGTRLPDGWEPPTGVVAQMRSDHPHIDLRAEHAKFIDYWRGKAGRDARKADWTATWRNWIRRADEQRPAVRPNGNHLSTSDLRVAQAQALKAVPSHRLELE